ncbi:hypothetical protein [Bacillus wiedmannii]|uniref:hypothetical protein n=1 Tax=Bacillus wiedmannii TaxID=1890302 RepID=UPI000BEF3BAD|nr:hypothetical protein [Bacillus wiedmannii]PEM08540.1 hypothetical protein CN610_20015 [Bacillus wiedmannii]
MKFEDKRKPVGTPVLEKGAIAVLASGQKLLIAVDTCQDVQLVDLESNIVVSDTCIDVKQMERVKREIESEFARIEEIIPASVVKVVAE